MKECGLCQRTRVDDNLWCQEKRCPAEEAPLRLRAGDRMGEIEIVQWLATLPAATLYKAQRGETIILLKVAHPGYEDKLKREALFLQSNSHPALPRLLPAFGGLSLQEHPYGKAAVHDRVVYFVVFAFVDGQMLREMLDRNPQPWYLTTGWLIAQLADALAFLNDGGLLHLCLSPELVLVRFDREGIPRPLLVDLGVACAYEDIPRYWRPAYVSPLYAGPELVRGETAGAATDVYGIGALFFEMLAGRPPVRGAAGATAGLPGPAATDEALALRTDLTALPQLAAHAVALDWRRRPATTRAFLQELMLSLPPVPRENRARAFRAEALRMLVIVALLIALLVILGIALT
jgi:serine/threonine protein kinase